MPRAGARVEVRVSEKVATRGNGTDRCACGRRKLAKNDGCKYCLLPLGEKRPARTVSARERLALVNRAIVRARQKEAAARITREILEGIGEREQRTGRWDGGRFS
jgi:hypothetical protein